MSTEGAVSYSKSGTNVKYGKRQTCEDSARDKRCEGFGNRALLDMKRNLYRLETEKSFQIETNYS